MRNLPKNSGFTIIELLVVIGLFVSIITLVWINFSTLPSRFTLNVTYENLISDLKNQQSESMNGVNSYGIYVSNKSYILFKGLTYDPNSSENFEIELENDNLSLGTDFLNQIIIFNSLNGEINNFDSSNNSITIADSLTGESKIITLNKYGVSI